ncbi:DUF6088 family protein [Chryseobacterium gotjawalense]|uniref:DUF6088 family protein n=1 Tax=Chryseobacterium gotjawalense TaxID=3042315 RepID=A0ABY8RBC0_9FLAO|nr:DUF6088 family protein [Chryseobacterium sp. wdc7]WHF51268.1 DUF6088 family protein [Chryseobacterium sp. wdc7]
MESIDNKILDKIKKAKRGSLFYTEDFLSFGNYKAVSKVLERLVNGKKVYRVARGIFSILEQDPYLGEILPTAEKIAESIRKRDKARIIPTGVLALNKLGLSSQIPMNLVYHTDGSARTVKVGNRKIVFKKASPKNLAAIGNISGIVIQALKEIGKDNVTDDEIQTILNHLKNEEPYRLEHDIKLAPEWIRIIMRKALTK